MKCFSYLTAFSNSVWQKPNCDFSSYRSFLHFPKDTMSYVKTCPLTNTLTVHIFTHTVCTLVHICNSDQGVQANVLQSNRHGSITCHFSAFPLSPGLGPCGTNSQVRIRSPSPMTSALLTIAIIVFLTAGLSPQFFEQ